MIMINVTWDLFDGISSKNDEKIFREFFQAYQENKAERGM